MTRASTSSISIFGAMFAPKPFDVAKEMVRVTKPGGRIVMGNWIPNDPTLVAQILKISASYSPPPPEGFVSPVTWGVEENVVERFTAAGVPEEAISCERDTYTFNSPGSPSELVAAFRTYYGPTMNAFEAAAADGREDDLQAELETLFNEQNTSDDGHVDPGDVPAGDGRALAQGAAIAQPSTAVTNSAKTSSGRASGSAARSKASPLSGARALGERNVNG